MLRTYRAAMQNRDVTHDGHSGLAVHLANARQVDTKWRHDDGEPVWRISKDRPGSPDKIDLAMCAALSWEARRDAIAAGEDQAPKRYWAGGI